MPLMTVNVCKRQTNDVNILKYHFYKFEKNKYCLQKYVKNIFINVNTVSNMEKYNEFDFKSH